MGNMYSISEVREKTIELFYVVFAFLLLILAPNPGSAQSQPIGPGKGSLEKNQIIGQFVKWERKATPTLVLRVHGASMLQTFADISATGAFKLPLPEIPAKGNFGSKNCGKYGTPPIMEVMEISLLTTLPGFASSRWDRGLGVIGGAFYADNAFSKNIGKPGGKRAHWLYSKVARVVEAGECNNTHSFSMEKGWNAFTVVFGPGGGPHTYTPGFDDDLGWYWYALPEDMTQKKSSIPNQNIDPDEKSEQPVTKGSEVRSEWLIGEWNGVQVDVRMQMRLQPSGDVWLESIENDRKKTVEGKWSLSKGEFVLDIKEGVLRFNIEQTSETGFRLFGKAASSDIVFTRKDGEGLKTPDIVASTPQPKSYPDGRGGEIHLPLGDLSFADEVVSFVPGSPSAADQHSIASEALSPPDYVDSVDDRYLTLGCGGELVVQFTDNVLGDVEGPDIFIFEIGQAIESTELAVSRDGKTWIDVGRIAGGVASINIEGRIKPGDTFRYLKLTDGKTACHGQWPGADIDAVAAIGAGRRVVLDSSVLFNVDEAKLKPEAAAVLGELAEEINGYGQARVILEGHTDSSGADVHNQQLSEARAATVGRFLVKHSVAASAIKTLGKGESQPIAPNDTEENRAKNRRVEALIFAR